MQSQQEAEELAEMMISIGTKMGKKVTAIITDMNQPLGSHVGNALEVIESVQLLKGECQPQQNDCLELSLTLAAYMILLGGKASDLKEARTMAETAIQDLSAYEKLKEIVKQQHGDPSALDDVKKLPTAAHSKILKTNHSGYLKKLDALSIGRGCVMLGAGRKALESIIDPAVGVIVRKKVGDRVSVEDAIMEIHYNDEGRLQEALHLFETAVEISPEPVDAPVLVKKEYL